MQQPIKNILSVVTTETLEKLAFLFAFPDDDRDNDGPAPAVTGRVNFNGFLSGSLMMRISRGAVTELVTNMLGLDDDSMVSDGQQQDAFKEMLNVICGNLLPAVFGDQVEFNIGPPEILTEDDTRIELTNKKPHCVERLMLEDGFCDVYFFADEQLGEDVNLKAPAQIS